MTIEHTGKVCDRQNQIDSECVGDIYLRFHLLYANTFSLSPKMTKMMQPLYRCDHIVVLTRAF